MRIDRSFVFALLPHGTEVVVQLANCHLLGVGSAFGRIYLFASKDVVDIVDIVRSTRNGLTYDEVIGLVPFRIYTA